MGKLLIIGAGRQAEAIAYDALKFGWADGITVADIKPGKAADLKQRLGNDRRLTPVLLDSRDNTTLNILMSGYVVTVGAADYSLNYDLTRAAIMAGSHFCDLGGNNDVVRRQFALSEMAADQKVRIVPDCGIAPGAVSPLASFLTSLCGRIPEYLRIRVGGLPQVPQGELGYALVFSPRGWMNEILEPTVILEDGKIRTVESMTGLETVNIFPPPFDRLEAVYTSGGSSTLTDTYAGLIRTLDYKTLRYPGHWEKMSLLKRLGFLDGGYITFDHGRGASPRELAEAIFDRTLPHNGKDVLLMSIEAGDGRGNVRLTMVDKYDEATGHTAMQRTTGYSAAIIAEMLMTGKIEEYGTLRQETAVPPLDFFLKMKERGFDIRIQVVGEIGLQKR